MSKPDLLSQKIISQLQISHLLSAKQLVEHFKNIGTPYNKTSIYRSIEKLVTAGVICKHDFSGGEFSYELQDQHHDHIICTHCGTVQKIDCQLQNLPEIAGYTIDHHHLNLYGLCQKCKQNL